MKNPRWLAILMVIAILGITGFQVYWLKQNYTREKRALTIKTDMLFRETMLRLQGSKLKLDGKTWESGDPGAVKVFMTDSMEGEMRVTVPAPEENVISTVNVIRDKLNDSLRRKGKTGMIIMNKTMVSSTGDTLRFTRPIPGHPDRRDYLYHLLYGVDSLQDSIKVDEIRNAYLASLEKQKINLPFSIIRIDSLVEREGPSRNMVTVGFAKPVTYRLELGNTFPYLLRQLISPILFSILLLGVTILSFVLLYRSLLRQRRLAELKNEFISNITHELKTPIATVGVAIEALRNFNAMQDPQKTREYLDISSNELHRLSLLVDKVLKLSMFEKKEIDLKYEPVNLQALTQEVVDSLRLQFEKNHAIVNLQTSGNTELRGDRLHLLSVVFNLVDNALKYSRENARIDVSLEGKENEVVLSVKDNGIGMSPEYHEKIFEKFFRIPHGDTHNTKGYGLGLSYVAQVIRKHNGSIVVNSRPGEGAEFVVTIPKTTIS